MSESFGFMVYQLAISVVIRLQPCLCREMRGTGHCNWLPAASLRTVIIRRHRSPTRAIIAVTFGKNLLDFRRTRSLTFDDCPRMWAGPNVPGFVSD